MTSPTSCHDTGHSQETLTDYSLISLDHDSDNIRIRIYAISDIHCKKNAISATLKTCCLDKNFKKRTRGFELRIDRMRKSWQENAPASGQLVMNLKLDVWGGELNCGKG